MNAPNPNANPYAPPAADVSDVHDGDELQRAARGARLGAALIDGFVPLLIAVVPLMLGVGVNFYTFGTVPPAVFKLLPIIGLLEAIWLGFTIYFVVQNRQTIGKKLLNIRVVRADGSEVGIGRLFWMRNVIGGVISAIPYIGNLWFLVDSLFIFTESQQCLHDKIADTIVVNA